jgi:hypothetical protein
MIGVEFAAHAAAFRLYQPLDRPGGAFDAIGSRRREKNRAIEEILLE